MNWISLGLNCYFDKKKTFEYVTFDFLRPNDWLINQEKLIDNVNDIDGEVKVKCFPVYQKQTLSL